MNIKDRIINGDMTCFEVCRDCYNELTQDDIDFIVKETWTGAYLLYSHPFFTQEHVDFIVKKDPRGAMTMLPHKLTYENLKYLEERYPRVFDELSYLVKPKKSEDKTLTERLTLKKLKEEKDKLNEKFKETIPYDCWRAFGCLTDVFDMYENQICLVKNGDYLNPTEWIEVLEYWLKHMKELKGE